MEKKTRTRQTNKYTINEAKEKWKKVFSSSMNSLGIGSGFSNSFFLNYGSMFVNDPYLLNQRIKQLKTLPKYLNREDIEEALLKPEFNEFALRQATRSEINLTYPLYKLLMLYEGMLTYRSYVHPKYVDSKDMNTKRFTSDEKFTDLWLKKLNPQEQCRRITEEVILEGKKAYYIRQSYNTTTGKESCDYVHFQELPSDWCKIIKTSTNSHFVIAFNFAYFWQAGTSVGQFPPIFAQYYAELMRYTRDDIDGKHYLDLDKVKSAKDVVVEYNSQTMEWCYWKELPNDECFVFSFDETNSIQASPFMSLLLPAQDLSTYALLQQQLLSIPLYSIIIGQQELHDDKNNSDVDDFRLSPDAVVYAEGKVNSSMPPGTSYVMTPSTNNQMFKFQEIPNANKIYMDGLQQLIANAGTTGLQSTTDKPNVAQVNVSKKTEVRFIDRIYSQFKKACNITLQKMYDNGDLKYMWEMHLFGDIFSDEDREDRDMKALSLGQKQFVPEVLALHDMTLSDAVSICNQVDNSKLYSKFEVLVNSFTSSTSNNKVNNKSDTNGDVGRPTIQNPENDSTANSQDNGSNVSEGREFSMNSCICPVCGKRVSIDSKTYPFCSEECKQQYIENVLEENGGEE